MKLATAVIEGFGLAKVTKEYLQQVWMLRKREVKRGNVRVVRVSPKRLAELAAEGKQDENPVTK